MAESRRHPFNRFMAALGAKPDGRGRIIRFRKATTASPLKSGIERWRDERKLGALSWQLPGYLSLNGLTDGWADLYEALKRTRALGHEAFSPADQDLLSDLVRGAERAVYRR